jgi:hypothetical protein
VGQHRSASASRLLGLDGLRSSPPVVAGGEWRLAVQTTATMAGCVGCGVRATPHGRRLVRVRDLPIGGTRRHRRPRPPNAKDVFSPGPPLLRRGWPWFHLDCARAAERLAAVGCRLW